MSHVKIFEDCGEHGVDNAAFLKWAAANTMCGYYLNLPTQSTARLHAAKCAHKLETGDSNSTNRKVCSLARTDLTKWADENGISWSRCPDC